VKYHKVSVWDLLNDYVDWRHRKTERDNFEDKLEGQSKEDINHVQ